MCRQIDRQTGWERERQRETERKSERQGDRESTTNWTEEEREKERKTKVDRQVERQDEAGTTGRDGRKGKERESPNTHTGTERKSESLLGLRESQLFDEVVSSLFL